MTAYPARQLARLTAPTTEPISLAEAKLYLRIDHAQDDTLISDLITTARHMAEQHLKRSLMTQSWKLTMDGCEHFALDLYGEQIVPLSMGPIASITNIMAVDREGTSTEVDNSYYRLSATRDAVLMNAGVNGFRIEITYSAGYGDAASVPRPIKLGLLSHVAALFDGRGLDADTALPASCLSLYASYREVGL
ncbi:MAG: head-tail connector protein [Rickettsiales bacterium]|nr:head-tail connector protein [Rickettsiales bacterium]